MKFRRFSAGFALFEIMIATILLCGLIYMFLAFNQTKHRQINSQNVGKQLAITMNALLTQLSNDLCQSGDTLSTCTGMPENSDFKTLLKKNHLDPDKATVIIN